MKTPDVRSFMDRHVPRSSVRLRTGRIVSAAVCCLAAGCGGDSRTAAPTSATRVGPVYTVLGRVTDGAAGFGGGFGLSLPFVVQAIDPAHAGRSAITRSSGEYFLEGLAAGSVTISASAEGYETTMTTLALTGNTRVDFALPRIAKSEMPNVAGVWGARMETGSGVGPAEFTLTQTGSSVSGTWWVPILEWRGTIAGTINAERTFTGTMNMQTPCSASAPLTWGLLDYSERWLTLSIALVPTSGACPSGTSNGRTFVLDRTCRVTSTLGLACDPIRPTGSTAVAMPRQQR